MRQYQNRETLEIYNLTDPMFFRLFENEEVEAKDLPILREISENEQEYNKLFIHLSGHFLSNHLPDDFFTYEDEDQLQIIEDFAWVPDENQYTNSDVYSLIDSLTYDVQTILKKGIR